MHTAAEKARAVADRQKEAEDRPKLSYDRRHNAAVMGGDIVMDAAGNYQDYWEGGEKPVTSAERRAAEEKAWGEKPLPDPGTEAMDAWVKGRKESGRGYEDIVVYLGSKHQDLYEVRQKPKAHIIIVPGTHRRFVRLLQNTSTQPLYIRPYFATFLGGRSGGANWHLVIKIEYL